MLSNIQIEKQMRNMKIPLNYCGFKDLIPKAKNVNNWFGIINLDSSKPNIINDPVGGTHWLGLVIINSNAFYFDSFGYDCPIEIMNFVKSCKPKHYGYNNFDIQNINDEHCGYYSMSFIKWMYDNHAKYPNIYDCANDYINKFDTNTKNNLNILRTLIKIPI